MSDPYAVFRWLPREDRPRYVRLMKGSTVVTVRDFRRLVIALWRAIARDLRGALQRP